jgi:hypothetical protein
VEAFHGSPVAIKKAPGTEPDAFYVAF